MPMREIPHNLRSTRPQSTFQKYMLANTPQRATGALQGVRSNALTEQFPGNTPQALRQAVTPGAPVTTDGDLRALTEEYTRWANTMRAAGFSEQQITEHPTFQNYQARLVHMIGNVADPELLKTQIDAQNQRVGQNDVYNKSATAIRDALVARQNTVTPPAGQGSPTTGVSPTGIDPNVINDAVSRVPQMEAGPARTASPGLLGFKDPRAILPSVSTPAPGVAPAANDAYAAMVMQPPRGVTVGGALGLGDTAVGAPTIPSTTPIDYSRVQPMPLPGVTPGPVGAGTGAVGATLQPGGNIDYTNVKPMPLPGVTPPPPGQWSGDQPVKPRYTTPPGEHRSGVMPPVSSQIGVSTTPLPQNAQVPSAPPTQTQTPSTPDPGSGTGALSKVFSSTPGPSAPAYQMDEGTKGYLSRISGNAF